jgi:hypothetical protein
VLQLTASWCISLCFYHEPFPHAHSAIHVFCIFSSWLSKALRLNRDKTSPSFGRLEAWFVLVILQGTSCPHTILARVFSQWPPFPPTSQKHGTLWSSPEVSVKRVSDTQLHSNLFLQGVMSISHLCVGHGLSMSIFCIYSLSLWVLRPHPASWPSLIFPAHKLFSTIPFKECYLF